MVVLLLSLALHAQATPTLSQDSTKKNAAKDTTKRVAPTDTSRNRNHTISINIGAKRRAELSSVTAKDIATAYRDPTARSLIERARVARLLQDSSLRAYQARVKQRISASIGLKSFAGAKLAFRQEAAARVSWSRTGGAHVEMLGARQVIPIADNKLQVMEDLFDSIDPPYFPGREGLFVNMGAKLASQSDSAIFVHPLDKGAEKVYKFATGDSITVRLPDSSMIRLVEVKVTAREPRWDAIVGSLWFDVSTAQLVRGAFRPSAPMDVWQIAAGETYDSTTGKSDMDEVPKWVTPLITPMVASIDMFLVEYGLYGGHWWLPRSQLVQGSARVSFMHLPFELEQTVSYPSVNGDIPEFPKLPPEAIDSGRPLRRAKRDSLLAQLRTASREDRPAIRHSLDSLRDVRDSVRARIDSLTACKGKEGERQYMRHDSDMNMDMVVTVPCDSAKLLASKELPPSIYGPGEETFDRSSLDQLAASLSMGAQSEWSPQPPKLHYGLGYGLTRYNRIEGLSTGVQVEEMLGRGYTLFGTARMATADLIPRVELALQRSNGRLTFGGGVYDRLAVANDWGDPLSFGASVASLVMGRDEGFYYRARGGEIGGQARTWLNWRVFAEQDRMAEPGTNFSLAHAVHSETNFSANIPVSNADQFGVRVKLLGGLGENPAGWRSRGEVRLEGQGGDFSFGRGAAEATVSRGLGLLTAGVTGSIGSTVGDVPAQRLWYLGGSQTVRGQVAGIMAGNAYWFSRAELGTQTVAQRYTVFSDLGWAGDRSSWAHPGRLMSGAGVGASWLDGLIRIDVARGLSPQKQWRADLTLESRW